MKHLSTVLNLQRCPYCNINRPNLTQRADIFSTKSHTSKNERFWGTYICANCGGVVLASSPNIDTFFLDTYPRSISIDESIPEKPRIFLTEAMECVSQPSLSIIGSASAIDAMLKIKGYKDGSLNSRIKKAADDHLITNDMAEWAHEVRLEANDQRHADEDAPLPNEEDAKRILEFALALAEYLFVLPSRIQRGLENTKEEK